MNGRAFRAAQKTTVVPAWVTLQTAQRIGAVAARLVSGAALVEGMGGASETQGARLHSLLGWRRRASQHGWHLTAMVLQAARAVRSSLLMIVT